jgi:hypothetical protein
LALSRNSLKNALDGRSEAHVEHSVGFIQNEDTNVGEVYRASLKVIDQATGGGNDNGVISAKLVDLEPHRSSANDKNAACTESVIGFGNLLSKLARWGDDEPYFVLFESQYHGKPKSEGFSGAGVGYTNKVLSAQSDGDRCFLDRGGSLDSVSFQKGAKLTWQIEGVKALRGLYI